MQLAKILVALDQSSFSKLAWNYAVALARDKRAKLLIVHVDEAGENSAAADAGGLPVEPSDEVSMLLLGDHLPADADVAYEHHLLHGDPAQEILRHAREQHVDLIVMGTHGRTGLSRLLLGSVAESVLREATCPVLTVKTPDPMPG
jgi:nucleotide-binding universal stress UspA family protein